MSSPSIVIASAARTAVGAFNGSFANTPAHELGITDHTVKFHVNAIMGKLSAQSSTEAVIQAARVGLIKL